MSTTQRSEGADRSDARRRVPLGIVAALSGVALTGPLATDLYLPAFPQMSQDLGAPEARVQLTLTAMMIGMALGQLLLGPCGDALGRRRLLLSGVGLFAVVSLLCTLATSAEVLVVLRFLQGTAGAAGAVLSRAVVRDLYTGDDAARLFTRLMMVTSLAPVIGPPLGAQLLLVGPWQLCFVALALVGAVNFVMVWFGIPETLPPARRTPLRLGPILSNIARLLRDPRFLAPMFALGLSYAAMFTYISSFSFVSQNELGATPTQFGLVFPLNAAMLILANQVNSVLIGRMNTSARLSIGLALGPSAVAGLIALQVFGDPTLVSVAGILLLLMFSMGFVFPNATTLALSEQPASVAGTGSALIGTHGNNAVRTGGRDLRSGRPHGRGRSDTDEYDRRHGRDGCSRYSAVPGTTTTQGLTRTDDRPSLLAPASARAVFVSRQAPTRDHGQFWPCAARGLLCSSPSL